MAEFRSKFRVEHDSVNIFDHKRVPDPPGYDPAAAREAVSERECEGTAIVQQLARAGLSRPCT